MATDISDRSLKNFLQDWQPGTVVAVVVLAFTICIAIFSALQPHSEKPIGTANRLPAPRVADMAPVIPWTPDGVVNRKETLPARREGPYTLMPDAPLLESAGGFVSLLGNGLSKTQFYISEHSNDKSFQGGDWVRENVSEGPDGLRLDVTATGDPEKPYALAEVQRLGSYGYGRYETIMRPAKGSGLVSAFFTYTGPYFGDPHDEIDIEFVGKNPSFVELNYFHKGETGHSARIKLPFDATEEDHLYAFDWKPEGISWYVDGKLIYQTPPNDPKLPKSAGRLMISNWTGKKQLQQWHGVPDFGDRGSAYYSCISFTPLGENTRRCSDVFQSGTKFPPSAE
ncbi:family 16 glycosylhydrolase [Hyphomonas sp.]|uniref:family 16 glycosylhydrolase n=1 Tax=Hyphomonas sp. TaxID=87 RepID=UPI003527C8D6